MSRFDTERARFYSAEIVCALRFLHRKGIVYRLPDISVSDVRLMTPLLQRSQARQPSPGLRGTHQDRGLRDVQATGVPG